APRAGRGRGPRAPAGDEPGPDRLRRVRPGEPARQGEHRGRRRGHRLPAGAPRGPVTGAARPGPTIRPAPAVRPGPAVPADRSSPAARRGRTVSPTPVAPPRGPPRILRLPDIQQLVGERTH